jgi:hypothetical protein
MSESQIRALFTEIADGEPPGSRVDTQLARRRGRARLRWRRARLGGTSVLAVAAVTTLAVTLSPARPGSAPPAGRAAPRQFNPLVPYIAFGWLPAGQPVGSGGITPAETYLGVGLPGWFLSAYARDQCHLTSPARGLTCPGSTLQIHQQAPDVAGHRAFWTGPRPGIAWQYGHGGWAWLAIPAASLSALLHNKTLEGQALKIAAHVRYGVPTRLAFPAQFSGLPSPWRVQNISDYTPDRGRLSADEYMLATGNSRFHPHVGDLGVWTDAPYVTVDPSPRGGTCDPHDPHSKNTSETINGYRVVLKRLHIGGLPVQELCGAHADGLWFDIQIFGAHPSISVTTLFKDHTRLLGTNPADWTTNPIR